MTGLPPAKGGGQSPLSIEHKHLDRGRKLLEALAAAVPAGFEPLRCAVALDVTLYSPLRCPPGDALNFLGGVGDVLQRKAVNIAGHLGPIADLALYQDDRQVRRVRFDQRTASGLRYVVQVRAIGRESLGIDWLPRKRNPVVSPGRPAGKTAELCVAFANASDLELRDYAGLLDWCVARGAIPDGTATKLRAVAAKGPRASLMVMRAARQLRDALRTVLEKSELDAADLSPITCAWQRCGAHETIDFKEGLLVVNCAPRPDDLTIPLCAITRSAGGLIGSNLRARVRRCADDRCGQLFIDRTKNRSRRWCDMSACGNRAKARRYQQRQRLSPSKASR